MPAASEIFAPGLLDGRVAIVTGGGTGLGAAAGAELIACGASRRHRRRREEVLEAAAAAARPSLHVAAGDIRDAPRPRAIVERAGRPRPLDVLVNNAGGQYFVPAESIALKGWNAVWRLNVGGHADDDAGAVGGGLGDRRGMVINVTLSPHHGLPGMTHSSAARAAVEALTRELPRELAPRRSPSSPSPPATSRPRRSRSTRTPCATRGAAPSRCSAWDEERARVARRAARLAARPRLQRLGRDARRRAATTGTAPGRRARDDGTSDRGAATVPTEAAPPAAARVGGHPRAWCNGCTRPFQGLSTGSSPVARSATTGVRRWHGPRGVAQSGSAPGWGPGGRRFKSCLPDGARDVGPRG